MQKDIEEMKEIKIETHILECQYEELSDIDRKLVDVAKAATRRSYAPYSKFHVGAAILMENGEIVAGSNQENAAYPSGTCAERTAVFYASAQYPGVRMRKIAIAAWTALHTDPESNYEAGYQQMPISPCGACRQALLEYETLYGPMEVILFGSEKIYKLPSVKSILPLCFTEF